MLIRFDPFRELDRLAREFRGNGQHTWMPMDAYRRDDGLVVSFDLPGVDPASIDVTVENGVLTVKAERSLPRAEDDRVVCSERAQGSFTRQLYLGEGLDGDRIEAHFDNGVLTLTIPVAAEARPRKVEVTSGNGSKAIAAESQAA
jgi:HSP20 family protein